MTTRAGLNVNLTLQAGNIQQIVASFQQLASQMQALGGQMNINVRQTRTGGGGVGGSGGFQQSGNILFQGLSRLVPGGGIAKAFKELGFLGGIATGTIAIAGFVKGMFDNSKVLNTFTSAFMRVFGHIVDILLLPIVPFLSKVLAWIVNTMFPLARRFSSWLGSGNDFEKLLKVVASVGAAIAGGSLASSALKYLAGVITGGVLGGGQKPPIPGDVSGSGVRSVLSKLGPYIIPAIVSEELVRNIVKSNPVKDEDPAKVITDALTKGLIAGGTTIAFTRNPWLSLGVGGAVAVAAIAKKMFAYGDFSFQTPAFFEEQQRKVVDNSVTNINTTVNVNQLNDFERNKLIADILDSQQEARGRTYLVAAAGAGSSK